MRSPESLTFSTFLRGDLGVTVTWVLGNTEKLREGINSGIRSLSVRTRSDTEVVNVEGKQMLIPSPRGCLKVLQRV